MGLGSVIGAQLWEDEVSCVPYVEYLRMDAVCLLELDVRRELLASLDRSHCDCLVGGVR